jgi:hypothetical protein
MRSLSSYNAKETICAPSPTTGILAPVLRVTVDVLVIGMVANDLKTMHEKGWVWKNPPPSVERNTYYIYIYGRHCSPVEVTSSTVASNDI